jgi:DNA adenine methylase
MRPRPSPEAVEKAADAVRAALKQASIARKTAKAAALPAPAVPQHTAKVIASGVRKDAEGADERFVMGMVLEPNIVDSQSETYDADEVRKAAHWYMEHGRKNDVQHDWKPLGPDQIRILESFVAPVEFELNGVTVKAGTWVLAVRVLDDALWQAILDGRITGFSIGGDADKYIRVG